MPPLATQDFDYDLPAELIAQVPAPRRDGSRLLVVDRARHTVAHHRFTDLPGFVGPGDVLFRNNAAVLPARLKGVRPTGGRVECFLLREIAAGVWQCLVKPGRKLPVGATFHDPSGAFRAEIRARGEDGGAEVAFVVPGGESIVDLARRLGEVPLPPYIARDAAHPTPGYDRSADRERYQTVYANPARTVAVAAPTAGLHFTPDLLARLADQGVRYADITLHVGLGTFRPISTDTIEAHAIHRETYELPFATQQALFAPETRRRIAVGTTSVRTLEDFLSQHSAPRSDGRDHLAEAGIYLYPPCRFRGVDALITNFHQPRSTLLCLVAALLAPGSIEGVGWLREIYREAVAERYRFLSYGDAMLIL